MKVALALLLTVALVAGGLALAVLTPEPEYTNEELRAFGFTALPQPRDLPAFDLADAAGGRFGPERLRGRWSLIFFGYANCPDICPITMSVLGEAEKLMRGAGDDPFQGILVSVDPERDTPQSLARYVAAFSGDFVGVTGDLADIEAFAKSLYAGFSKVAVEDSALGYLMDHTSHIAVIDRRGRHYGYIKPPFDERKIATLAQALRLRDEGTFRCSPLPLQDMHGPSPIACSRFPR